MNENRIANLSRFEWRRLSLLRRLGILGGLLMCGAFAQTVLATQNVPYTPFAEWAYVPLEGQFVLGMIYQESEAYHIWARNEFHDVTWKSGGEYYGNDNHQGWFALQYGLTERWALDLNVGFGSAGWRFYDNGEIQSTTGLLDWSFGVRYQIFNETNATSPWVPTLTFRAGAVMPGSYDENFIFAPGLSSAAIMPELLMRKKFGWPWPGLGLYADGSFINNRTTGNNQYIISSGLFQQIKGWEVDFGYQHLQTLSGSDIIYPASNGIYNIIYPRDPRENRDAIQFGFYYTTSTLHWRYGFQLTSVLQGCNSDAKLWLGGSIDIPFGGKHTESKTLGK